MNIILLTIFNVLDLYVIYYFFNKLYEKKFNKKEFMSFVILLIIMTLINHQNNHVLNNFIFLVTIFVITKFIFNLNLPFSLLFSIIYLLISSPVEMLTFFFISIFISEPMNNDFVFLIFIVINIIIKYLCLNSMYTLKTISSNKFNMKILCPILILPISFVFLIIGISKNIEFVNIFLKISIILSFTSTFIIVYILNKMNENIILKNELINLHEYEKINKLYISLIEEKYNSNRRYIHDYSKHVNILNKLSDENNIKQLKKYINSMYVDSKQLMKNINSGNKVLDIIISSISGKNDINNIEFIFEKIDDFQFKNEYFYQIITILYNALENAIESCNRCNGGLIKIKFCQTNTEYFVIRIINTSLPVDITCLKTSKINSDAHGLGVTSIKKETEHLDGIFEISFDIEYNEFRTNILLPNKIII